VVVLAHGAGAGMDHPFMCALHEGLAAAGCLAVKFDFPYMAAGRRAPDRAPVLENAWRAVLGAARERASGVPLVAGGKSMGGRMASRVLAADAARRPADALLLLGYPLHPAGRPQRLRADHFPQVRVPSLFVQGTRDALCDLDRLRALLPTLGAPSRLEVVDGGDHSFRVLKRSGRDQHEVDAAVLAACVDWIGGLGRAR
jgi:predicted alpha/beta-hydrolase family hydrolase